MSVVLLLQNIIYQGQSFKTALSQSKATQDNQAEVQAIAYGVLRHYQQLYASLMLLLKKSMKNKDKDMELLLISAMFQLSQSSTPDYAIVNETVKLAKKGKKKWAANLINGVLRNYCRSLETNQNSHDVVLLPDWMSERFNRDWPEQFNSICKQSNIHAPMSIRVNLKKTTRDEYMKQLSHAGIKAEISDVVSSGILLKAPVPVEDLPGFWDGLCSVQDLAAQLAGIILQPKSGDVILDACAAPGGKTGHILEQQDCQVIACDIDGKRLLRVVENVSRLQLNATIKEADMLDINAFEEEKFDRILLDAPCSALGIIRRHPDIKFLRKPTDIQPLVDMQATILTNCWFWLKPGGVLLYATCSILKQENEQQINTFLTNTNNAKLEKIVLDVKSNSSTGLQVLPGEHNMDGFYYAKINKQ